MPAARTSPRSRPPAGARAVLAVLGLAALAFNAALMMSDRAPGVLRRLLGEAVQRLSERIDAPARAAVIASDPRLPEGDAIVHIAVWAVATLLVGLTVWTWVGLLAGAIGVFAVSAVIELAQGRTDTRAVELSDVVANATGVALGTVAAGLCYVAWSAGARAFGRRRW